MMEHEGIRTEILLFSLSVKNIEVKYIQNKLNELYRILDICTLWSLKPRNVISCDKLLLSSLFVIAINLF